MGRILVGLGWGLYKGEDAGMVTAYGKGRNNDLDMYIIHVDRQSYLASLSGTCAPWTEIISF